MTATYHQYILNFKKPAGTSRGVLKTKETWFIVIRDNDKTGIGECGLLRGLSVDDVPEYEFHLQYVCENIHLGLDRLYAQMQKFPSIQFGLEMAFQSLYKQTPFLLFPSEFTNGKKAIDINGLIWMGDANFMKNQIRDKLEEGFNCIKLKIGAIDFETELSLLQSIRNEFSAGDIEIRVDANGAFKPNEALKKLHQLSQFDLHSIEQPIAVNQCGEMAKLCQQTPIPIALDEELIGVYEASQKENLLQEIKPQYIILKPSFIGGFQGTQSWIKLAEKHQIGYWITSALESNVGLNAIAQFAYHLNLKMPQGLGTGSLFTNNFDSPLQVKNGKLHYNNLINWNFNL
jgi:o-succinylbenzoate synthase